MSGQIPRGLRHHLHGVADMLDVERLLAAASPGLGQAHDVTYLAPVEVMLEESFTRGTRQTHAGQQGPPDLETLGVVQWRVSNSKRHARQDSLIESRNSIGRQKQDAPVVFDATKEY